MEAIEALKTRRSIRSYQTGRPIDREILADLVDCARLAPTAMNDQPWEFVVVTSAQRLTEIAKATGHAKFLPSAAAGVVILAKVTQYYIEDVSAATENLLVAATAHGLGACWIAAEKQAYADDIRRLVGAPEEYRCFAVVSLGYPAEKPNIEKRPLDSVLHWEQF
jgi:nitroreductase